MKVLQVINSLGAGGAERLVVDLVRGLRELDVQSDVLVLRSGRSFLPASLLPPGARLLTSSKEMADRSPLHILEVARAMRGYDVVHSHLFPTQYWVVLASLLLGSESPTLVTTEHNTYHNRMKWKPLQGLERWVFDHYARIATISPETTVAVQRWLELPAGRFVTITNGIDLTRFADADPYSRKSDVCPTLRDEDELVLQVGRLTFQKGHRTLFSAMTRLPERYKAILVGEGDLRSQHEDLCRKLGIASRVIFLGIREDVPRLFKTSSVCVMPSEYEGFGLAAVEAMASGVPLVASDVPGLGGVVRGAGVTVARGDAAALAASILDVTTLDTRARERLLKRQFERATEYDVATMTRAYAELYRDVFRNSGG